MDQMIQMKTNKLPLFIEDSNCYWKMKQWLQQCPSALVFCQIFVCMEGSQVPFDQNLLLFLILFCFLTFFVNIFFFVYVKLTLQCIIVLNKISLWMAFARKYMLNKKIERY